MNLVNFHDWTLVKVFASDSFFICFWIVSLSIWTVVRPIVLEIVLFKSLVISNSSWSMNCPVFWFTKFKRLFAKNNKLFNNVSIALFAKIRHYIRSHWNNMRDADDHSFNFNVIFCLRNSSKPKLNEASCKVHFIHVLKCKLSIIHE